MKIRKSQLRQAVNEQVRSFFVTPESMGMVGVRGNATGGSNKLEEDDIDKDELKKIIRQVVDDVEAGSAARMQSGGPGKINHNGRITEARGYKERAKANKEDFIRKVRSLIPKNKQRSIDKKQLNHLYDYGSSPEDAAKKLMGEAKWYDQIKRPPEVGDKVHIGHIQKGGAGVTGVVTKIKGDRVDIKDPKSKKTFYGSLKKTAIIEICGVDSLKPNDPHTPEDEAEKDAADDVMEVKEKGPRQLTNPKKEVMVVKKNKVIVIDKKDEEKYLKKGWGLAEISGVDSLKPNDPHTPEDEAEKDAADDVMEAGPKKKGGRPRGAPHIENLRFWDMSEIQLRYIIKDAGEAVKANPTARKAGKWADEINDAVTVLYWRKKKGIKEVNTQGAITEGFKEGSNISKLLKKSSTIKMANPGRAKGIGVKHAVPGRTFVIASRFGSKGITSAGEQDKVSMAVVDKAGKVIKDYGSHVNAKGALKFAKSRGYTKKVNESFNTAPAAQGQEAASVIGANESPEMGSLASSPKAKALIKQMNDLVTKRLKFKTVEDIQPIKGGVAFIFGDKAEASKMSKYLKKSGALGKVVPMARERIMVSLRTK